MKLSNKQENEKIKAQTIELYELEKKFKKIKKAYESKKSNLLVTLKNFMYCNKPFEDEFTFLANKGETFSADNKMLRVKRIEPSSVVWDADKLSECLPKEIAAQVINKTYTIEDMKGLIKYLKACGVDPTKFKSYISIDSKVDVDALEQLEAVGELSLNEVKGCYEVIKKSSYLRLDIVEGED